LSGEEEEGEEEEEEDDWWLLDQVATSSHLVKTYFYDCIVHFTVKIFKFRNAFFTPKNGVKK
jgi:hypothetical protein